MKLFGCRRDSVTATEPVDDGVEIGLRRPMVAEHRMVEPSADGIDDTVGRWEVHIGDPHGQQVITLEEMVEAVVLNAVGVATRNYLVKVVGHCFC